ncbi:retinol dehydrogenase-12 [Catenulispora sp. GP43]|uniref:SDR family NAD(P)-dependent oxidoreductase n=1 Tax=Catenulispora sp. GP43 TaxID=3156263 RepID=UPI0035184ED5
MKTVLVTGSSAGIGAAAAVALCAQGHRVQITGRSVEKLAAVRRRMTAAAPPDVDVPEPIASDLASLDGVRTLARTVLDRHDRLDVLVNNAAVQPVRRQVSADGIELGWAVNHLAVFVMTAALTDRLADSGGRVVTTSSDAHADGVIDLDDIPMEHQWTAAASYGRSKLANILFTTELARRTGLPASSFHPGSISTDLNRDSRLFRVGKPIEKIIYGSPAKGAQTLVWLATSAEGGKPSAAYYVKRAAAVPSDSALDAELAARLWDNSAEMAKVTTT